MLMKRFSKISVIFTFLAFTACTVEQPVLDDSSQLAVEEEPDKGTPALLANKGVLDDFSGDRKECRSKVYAFRQRI
jgi:hypothetical protein